MTQARRAMEPSRMLVVGGAGLFVLSGLFPLGVSVVDADRLPKWVGVADVAIAGVLILLGLLLISRKPDGFAVSVVATSFRAYRALASCLLILLVLFFTTGDRIRWNILLPGLAWRAWLLTMVLPSWLSLRREENA